MRRRIYGELFELLEGFGEKTREEGSESGEKEKKIKTACRLDLKTIIFYYLKCRHIF